MFYKKFLSSLVIAATLFTISSHALAGDESEPSRGPDSAPSTPAPFDEEPANEYETVKNKETRAPKSDFSQEFLDKMKGAESSGRAEPAVESPVSEPENHRSFQKSFR